MPPQQSRRAVDGVCASPRTAAVCQKLPSKEIKLADQCALIPVAFTSAELIAISFSTCAANSVQS
jgi:hypothetical protein